MKKNIIIILASFCLFGTAFSQASFSVSPGFLSNTATFGYRSGNINPYIGINATSMSSNITQTYEELVGFDSTGFPVYEDVESEAKVKMSLIVPTIGSKFYFPMGDNVSAYANVAVMIPIMSIKLKDDSQTYEPLEDDLDKFSIWGARAGFGAEYNLSPAFSLGGEFGFNYYRMGIATDNSFSSLDMSAALVPTYSRITLNFLLSGKAAE